jgi:hypothetical protein
MQGCAMQGCGRLLATKSQDQLNQPHRQRDIANRHHDLIRGMPIDLCQSVQAVEKIQEQEYDPEQLDAAPDQAIALKVMA